MINCLACNRTLSQILPLSVRGGRPVQVRVWITWLLLAGGVMTGDAQIILDGKFGSSGALTGPNYNITAGLGRTRGNNLFHSFSQFNLQSGDTAAFSGPANIQNILARVTGGSASSIDGTLRSDIAGANLFLINPNGVLFGPNAVVDVTGSFAASTANYLKLADGARFVASLDADDSGLSTAPVSAFGFLGNNPGTISIQQSALAVQEGKTISLVGGDIAMDGGLVQAPGGRINLASVQSAGEVRLCSGAQARSIASKSGDRTAVIDDVAVGLRQIPVYVAPKSSGGLIDGGPCHFGELGIPLGDCRSKYLGHQVGLRLKVVIKATLRKAGMLHQFAQPDGLHSPFSE